MNLDLEKLVVTEHGLKKLDQQAFARIDNPINPDRPCRVFLFPIHKAIEEMLNGVEGRENEYEATRKYWKVTEQYRDVSKYRW
ncbi:hypothetical protein FACS1894161_0420 [Spirochaetia bacterium]|nr:hypothetical protein FACS1894161_0420 [Spirochaetia bacterium]